VILVIKDEQGNETEVEVDLIDTLAEVPAPNRIWGWA